MAISQIYHHEGTCMTFFVIDGEIQRFNKWYLYNNKNKIMVQIKDPPLLRAREKLRNRSNFILIINDKRVKCYQVVYKKNTIWAAYTETWDSWKNALESDIFNQQACHIPKKWREAIIRNRFPVVAGRLDSLKRSRRPGTNMPRLATAQ